MKAGKDRRPTRQTTLGRLRLDLAAGEHSLELAKERAENHAALAEALRREDAEHRRQAGVAEALRDQLNAELAQAVRALEAVPTLAPPSEPADPTQAQHAQRAPQQALRAVAIPTSSLPALSTMPDSSHQPRT